ncbi:MAG: GMC family oxidoreductase [Proteobacteria bacterium]|nr:GMC family oxidoreductase [Pseudomonadota bacterium]
MGVIRSGTQVPTGFTARTDVCIIGSGAGGGVAAGLLAEAGREVLVLEEGRHVPGEDMTQREEEMYPLLYRDGGSQYTADGGVSVLQGRTLGGSTVVNMADVVPIELPILEHWRRGFGLDRYSDERWEEASRASQEGVFANRIPPEMVNLNGQILLEGGEKTGHSGGCFDHNRVGCVSSGYCSVGCAYDAKKSVAVTWIPRALATGRALVQTDARVESLERDGARITAVVGSIIERNTNRVVAPFRVEADHVILAAGAIHSPLLLDGIGGPALGQNLSLNPQAPLTALMSGDVKHYRGIPQAAYLDDEEVISAELGLGGYRIESIGSTPGMAAASLPIWGPTAREVFARFNQTVAALVLVPDRPGGTVTRKANGRPNIDYTLQEGWKRALRRGLRVGAEVYLATGADSVLLPLVGSTPIRNGDDLAQIDELPIDANWLPLISAHPQGTCRAGTERATSVVDRRFFVHGIQNLQVLDASVFPTTSSSHTMIPVMQVAHLGVGELL